MPRFTGIPHENWERAHEMRQHPTPAERLLWRALRNRQLGVRFLRQHPIGPYIADFFCYECQLVVEVDGRTHAMPEAEDYDRQRDMYLQELGIRVRRFSNRDVLNNMAWVLQALTAEIQRAAL